MKRIIAALISAVLLFCLFAPAGMASEAADAARESTFTISIYNDVTDDYAMENVTFTSSGVTIFRSINYLKAQGMIADFTQGETELLELRYFLTTPESSGIAGESGAASSETARETVLLRSNDVDRFYVKQNGVAIAGDALNKYIRDGDIIEWIYGEPPEIPVDASSQPEAEPAKPLTEYWTDAMASVLNNACSWLNRNPDTNTLYLTAMGSAGKTADLKTIASLLTGVRSSTAEQSPESLAKAVLNLSYSGYDRSDQDMANLLSELMERSMGAEDGLVARAYTLISFDSRNYTIPNAVTNSRQTLIKGILAFQQKDGSFAANEGGVGEVDSTALALTALSRYLDQADVSGAVEKGLAYLSSVQMESGSFRMNGQVNSRSVSRVITALCALGLQLDDSRFVKGEVTPLDVLMQYAGNDGGFSLGQGSSSDAEATEFAVVALAAVRRSGNPYLVPASLKTSVPTVAPPAALPEELAGSNGTVYLVVGIACITAFVGLLLLLIRNLKKDRKAAGQDEAEDSAISGTLAENEPAKGPSTTQDKEGDTDGRESHK